MDDLRSIHAHRHDKLKVKCPTCSQDVVKAFDEKRGVERLFDLVNKTGRFIIREGKAEWWGPTGGEAEVHGCNPRRVTADNVLGTVEDIPDWDEAGYNSPRPRRGVGR